VRLQAGIISGAGTINGDFVNDGGILAPSRGTLVVTGNCVQNAGSTQIDAMTTLSIASGKMMTINGGTLSGNGTIAGDVLNNGGIVSPGASPGTLTITGNYTQTSTGVLSVELAGLTQGVTYDLLAITGNASLAGALNIVATAGFFPGAGDAFDIMTYASVTGDFATFTGGFAGTSTSTFYRLQLITDVVNQDVVNRTLPQACQ
jgi:hypothetical protein